MKRKFLVKLDIVANSRQQIDIVESLNQAYSIELIRSIRIKLNLPSLMFDANMRVAWNMAAADHLSGDMTSRMSSQLVRRGRSLNVFEYTNLIK